MKKLMIAGVVGLCAAVTFALESANIVGYQNVPVDTGFVLFTPTFKGIGGEMPLSDIVIVAEDGSPSTVMGGVLVQKMDASGAYLDTYAYFEGMGWIGADGVTIKPGEAICVNNAEANTVYFRVSGEVDLVNKNKVGQGFVLWGNSTPVTVNLSDITIVDADGNELPIVGEIAAQKMDASGAYLDSYIYFAGMGWMGADGITLTPGESLCINNTGMVDVFLKVPSPVK